MARRKLSESGYYHVTSRSAGQIALFEDDNDRRAYLRLVKTARDREHIRIIAWVLMTDHTHLIVDCADRPESVSNFMHIVDARYTRYFNARTGRSGTLFQGVFWSKPIVDDAQLIATVHYVHMNPQAAHICGMRDYRWSSYREYAGLHWMVDTSTVIGLFGSFEAFDAYEGSPADVVRRKRSKTEEDGDLLAMAIAMANVQSSAELRLLPRTRRNELIRMIRAEGATIRQIARTFGIGVSTVSRVLST